MSSFLEHTRSSLSRRQAAAVLLGALGTGLAASCGPVRPPRVAIGSRGSTRLSVATPRLDAVPGRLLVIPVRVAGRLPGSVVPRLTLADGRQIEASLVWIGIETDEAAWSGWLPTVTRWVVTPVHEGAIPASVGAWHVVAHLPADAAGQSLQLDSRTIPVNWLAAPEDLQPGGVAPGETWAPWRTPEGISPPDATLLAPEWRSPLRQWRAKLVTSGLGSPRLWQVEGDPAILDGLADLVEARWRVGLARLWYADAEACTRLLARLTRTVEFAPPSAARFSEPVSSAARLSAPIAAPAWPTSQSLLDSLLADLLDPTLAGESLVARSNAWLDSLPSAAAWVADDAAGLVGPQSEPLVQLRAAGLGAAPTLLWAHGRDGVRIGEPQPLEPGRICEIITPADQGVPLTGSRRFILRYGNHATTLATQEAQAVRPPGASCGPLLYDWTLDTWAASQPHAGAMPAPQWTAVALLYHKNFSDARFAESRVAHRQAVRDTLEAASGWQLFLECAAAEIPEPGLDEVGLWFGQRGASAAVLHISRDGSLRDQRRPEEKTILKVADQGTRWSVSVPIPPEAIEPGNMLRLGLTRRDARGIRTAWPRRLMPWDHEPARAAFDLTTWSGLEPDDLSYRF